MLFSVRNGLKEDALVDIPNTLTVSQLILIISLFTLLIGWFIIFAYLALRPTSEKYGELTEQINTLPVIKSPETRTLPIALRSPGRCAITEQTSIVTVSADSAREMVLDRSMHY